MSIKPRVKVPKSADAGEVVTIKTLISHPMESGVRKDKEGNIIPRNIIHTFTCTANGAEVFSADLEPAISSPAYLEFSLRVDETTDVEMTWTGDDEEVWSQKKTIKVG